MKAATTLIISLLLAMPVLADDAMTVFGGGFSRDDVAKGGSSVGGTYQPPPSRTEWNGEIGVAFAHAWNERWSGEASVAYRQSHSYISEIVGNVPMTLNRKSKTYPVDATVRYHLANGNRWRPYLSAGARYVNGSDFLVNDFSTATIFVPIKTRSAASRLSAEVGGGVTVMLTHGFGLRGDYKRLLRNDDSLFDPINRATFGFEWKL